METNWVETQIRSLSAGDWEPSVEAGIQRLRAGRRRQAVRRAMLLGVPLLAGAALVFPSTRALAGQCVEACVAAGGRLVWSKLERPVVAERRAAPDFVLTDADGRVVQLSALKGKVVLLNFWATWCRPCGVEIPWFVEFQKRYASQGFTVIGAALDEDGWQAVRPFTGKLGVNYPVVLGDDALVERFGKLDAVPATLVIDRAGRIAVMHHGLVDRGVYQKEIEAALGE